MSPKVGIKFERKQHLEHLVNVAPLIVIAYGIQCWLISSFFPEQKLSHFSVPLALSLIMMMSGLVIYDSYSSFEMFDDHLVMKFPLFGQKTYFYDDILSVEILDPEASFSNIILNFEHNKFKMIYFIDNPNDIKNIIEKFHTHQNKTQNFAA